MSDYKWAIQMIFEEKVAELHEGKEYWEISDAEQDRLYMEAQRSYVDRMADHADYLRKKERESQ